MDGKIDDLITVEEAARLTGYSEGYIRQLLNRGLVDGRKFVRSWLVVRESVIAFADKAQAKRDTDKRYGPEA